VCTYVYGRACVRDCCTESSSTSLSVDQAGPVNRAAPVDRPSPAAGNFRSGSLSTADVITGESFLFSFVLFFFSFSLSLFPRRCYSTDPDSLDPAARVREIVYFVSVLGNNPRIAAFFRESNRDNSSVAIRCATCTRDPTDSFPCGFYLPINVCLFLIAY